MSVTTRGSSFENCMDSPFLNLLNMDKSYISFLLLFCLIFMSGCSNCDEPSFNDEETDFVTFSIDLDNSTANGNSTRSLASGYQFADAKSISIVKCYVYNQANGANAQPVKVVDINVSNLKGNVSIPLPKNQTFDFVFLATSIPQDNSSSKLYYSPSERSVALNYSAICSSDEEIDCFFASKTGLTTETVISDAIKLKRPFAQVNIGAKDYAAYNASYPIKDITVNVTGVYSKFSLMDGSVIGDPVTASFQPSAAPSSQTFPVSGSSYLAMNYVLVNLRKLVDVTISINHQDASYGSMDMTFKEIAVERNYQTNLYIRSLSE